MNKKKVLLSIVLTALLVVVIGVIAAVLVKTKKPVETVSPTVNQTVEMGISEENSEFIEYDGYTILVYGGSAELTDSYLNEVVTGVSDIQEAFAEEKAGGFVLMYPENDSCSVLVYGQRSDLYFTSGKYASWQGFELIEQVVEFEELYEKLQSKLK